MAGSTMLGKRKAAAIQPAFGLETRKRRALRLAASSVVDSPRDQTYGIDNETAENDENSPPPSLFSTVVANGNGVLDEDSTIRVESYGDDDTPCRRREKRGRKGFFQNTPALTKASTRAGKTLSDFSASRDIASTQLATPKTPRHRDALPVASTPKHQVRVVGRAPLTPQTPRTPNGSAVSVYNTARQLFARSSGSDALVGRESELYTITDFIESGIADKAGQALYISGPPGTGKSAFTNKITEGFRNRRGVRLANVNCMSVRNSADLFARLLEALAEDTEQTEEGMHHSLKKLFFPVDKNSTSLHLITLDEVDNLLNLNVETLYTLFEWALDRTSNVILIGIANALDLTDRFLPRLKAKNLRPQLLPFIPYTAPQIISVVTEKLKTVLPAGAPSDFVPFLQPPAIQLCAKKVASQTGDLRKAFDILRRAIDLVEADVRAKYAAAYGRQQPTTPTGSKILGENANLASPQRSATVSPPESTVSAATAVANLTILTAPRAGLVHVSKVAASAFSNGTASRLKTLNLQQKAALCAVVAHTNRILAVARGSSTSNAPGQSPADAAGVQQRAKLGFHASPTGYSQAVAGAPGMTAAAIRSAQAPTVRQLYAVYVSLCRREGALATLSSTEFADLIASLEGLGLVVEERNPLTTPRKAKGLGFSREEKRVRGCVSEKEVNASLEGPAGELLRGLLRGDEA